MEVFISNLNPQTTTDKIEEWLVPILNGVDIQVYMLNRAHNKSFAKLTIADAVKAQALLTKTRIIAASLPRHPRSNEPVSFKVSKYPPDPVLIKVLQKEEKEFQSPNALPKFGSGPRSSAHVPDKQKTLYEVKSIECGRWEIRRGQRLFITYSKIDVKGSVVRNGPILTVTGNSTSGQPRFGVFFDQNNVQSIVIPTSATADHFLITLDLAPRTHRWPVVLGLPTILSELFLLTSNQDSEKAIRHGAIPGASDVVAGSCLVYQITLQSMIKKGVLRNFLEPLTRGRFPIRVEETYRPTEPTKSFQKQVADLDHASVLHQLPFSVRFQLHALWRNATLSPGEVQRLLPTIVSMQNSGVDEHDVAYALRFVHSQLPFVGPGFPVTGSGADRACKMLSQSAEIINPNHEVVRSGEVMIHRVTVTPAGTYLFGPDKETANRVIRQHIRHSDHFIRVMFADESGDKIMFDSEISNEHVLRGRFLSVLQQGLEIAGEHFEFLGFSHSSLRSQTCWFMRSFIHRGVSLTARSVIASLGDFSHIRNPAKCAARIGQAFSDTQKVVAINADEVRTTDDIRSGRFTFTDGCGTISRLLWERITNKDSNSAPTLFQIRYAGAKGMLSLDTRLSGHQLLLRPSMIKFTGSPSKDVEICGTNDHPLPFRLNRQIVKILEDLGVNYGVFETIQQQAVENLRRSARSTRSATDFFCANLADDPTGIALLVRQLAEIGVDVTEDHFIRAVIRGLIEVQLRDLKFRTRIPVNQAATLYGICDETGFLEEGQVYVTFETQAGRHSFLKGRVLVTRSPALHPGDVQIATAVAAPHGSPLTELTNGIVFSTKGTRDLPSMLAGGDLDGDLFGVIYDADLIPSRTDSPAEYLQAHSVDLGRSVTSGDMTKFFVDFMENDQLGRIATLHQVYADQAKKGTFDQVCLRLAELHSIAVDFSKSGRPVDLKAIPKTPACRPDFMALSTSTKIHRGIKDAETAAGIDSNSPQRYKFYESDRVLGKLYRSINEDDFFEDLQDDNMSIYSREGSDDVMSLVWDLVQSLNSSDTWKTHLESAQQVKDHYESMMSDIMTIYAGGHGQSQQLTEQEVLIGTIISRRGNTSNRHQREQSEMMKLRYKRGVQDLKQWMKIHSTKHPSDENDDKERGNTYLDLSIACLSLCTTSTDLPPRHRDSELDLGPTGDHSSLKSFGWFAAAICVPKLMTMMTAAQQTESSLFDFSSLSLG